MLAAPVDDGLFFAGEACSRSDYSTAHGAYLTGVDAADLAIAARRRRRYSCRQEAATYPRPTISTAHVKTSAPGRAPRRGSTPAAPVSPQPLQVHVADPVTPQLSG